MLRRILPLSAAVLVTLGCGRAAAVTVTFPVDGDVSKLALSGRTLVVARHSSRGELVVERLAVGLPARVVFSEPHGDPGDQVVLAASSEALAMGVQPAGGDLSPNRVLVGPAAGPLRQVAACRAGLIVSPVAVSGSFVAWRDGGCGEPAGNPRGVTSSAIVMGGAHPSTPLRRTELGSGLLPASIFLNGQTGIIGLLSPAFLLFDSQIARFGPAGLGSKVAMEQGRLTTPVGLLADGTSVVSVSDESASQTSAPACTTSLFAVAPGSDVRRALSLGGCYQESDNAFVTNSAAAAADRVFALVADAPAQRDRPPTLTLASVRGDGSGRAAVVSGTYRAPAGFAATPTRIAWWQPHCAGGDEVVVQDVTPGSAAVRTVSCTATVLTRRVSVRNGRVTLRVRCPVGCHGRIFSDSSLAALSAQRGARRVRLTVSAAERRRGRIRVVVEIDNGPARSTIIRLRG